MSQADTAKEFNTQERPHFRSKLPAWVQQLPRIRFPEQPNPHFQMIDLKAFKASHPDLDPQAVARIEEDVDFLQHELLRLFVERDHQAKLHQNRYRYYQILFMLLAALAALIGSIQALLIDSSPNAVPYFAFGETLVALAASYLATVSGREAPLPLWMKNRQRAEQLRREYFRYLLDLPPYNNTKLSKSDREQLLSLRAANINRGYDPDQNMTTNISTSTERKATP
jgi:hypothetical protein